MARKKRKPFRLQVVVFIFIALVALGAMRFVDFVKEYVASKDFVFETLAQVEYDQDHVPKARAFRGDFLLYEGKYLKRLSSKGKEIWRFEKTEASPILKVSEDRVFIGDKKSGKIICLNAQGILIWQSTFKGSITNMVSNPVGNLIIYGKNDQGDLVNVLDLYGRVVANIEFSESSILDVAISPSGERFSLALMNMENDELKSKIMLYQQNGRLLGGNDYSNKLLTRVFFSEEENLLGLLDQSMIWFSKEKGQIAESKIDGNMNRVYWNPKDHFIMYLTNEDTSIMNTKNKRYLWILDHKGKEIASIPVSEDIVGMTSFKDSVVAYNDQTLHISLNYGKYSVKKHMDGEIESAYLLSQNELLVVSKDGVQVMSIKHETQSGGKNHE